MKLLNLLCLLFIADMGIADAQRRSENIILITLDGYRWQEVFHGADSAILFNPKFISDTSAVKTFWHSDVNVRRQKLMPFLWNVVSLKGQLYGNRDHKNAVACANPYRMSYPGYSEMLVGYIDAGIWSNKKKKNRNSNVLAFIRNQTNCNDDVALFSTWSALPFITGSESSHIYTNSGNEKAIADSLTEKEILLNDFQDYVSNPYGERFDAFTFYYALEYLKRKSPHALMISFDETDEHGHGGRYDQYLFAARRIDQMIGELWQWLQANEKYKDKTTMIVTTDHGRGKGPCGGWKRHGRFTPGSNQTWFAVIGPDTPPLGEMKSHGRYFQKQIAKTLAAFLGLAYVNKKPVGEVIQSAVVNVPINLEDKSASSE